MKRYALFFVLICTQVNITLPMWKFFSQKEEDPVNNFKNQMDQAVGIEHRFNALDLKGICSKYLEVIKQLPYPDRQTILRDIKGEAEFCIGNYAQEKAKKKYEQHTTRSLFGRIWGKEPYNELIHQEYGDKARQKAIHRFRKGAGKLSYLFADYSSADILKKVEDECGKRLAVGSIWFAVAKNEADRKQNQEN